MNEIALVKQEDGSYSLSLPEPTAEMEASAGVLGGITDFKVFDSPIGQAVVGGFGAVIGSEIIDGFLKIGPGETDRTKLNTGGIVKLAAAGASVKWGGKLLGSTGSKAAALLLAYDGIRMIIPLDEYANKVAGMFTKLTGQGLAGRAGMGGNNVLNQAGDVANSYYSSLSRRAG